MTKLIIMVGLSGSGKSSIAKELSTKEDAVIVSTDNIREEISFYEDQSRNEEVFIIFYKRIRENLSNDISVIADATNLTIKSRKQLIEIGKRYNAHICAYICAKRFHECMSDNRDRLHPVPEHVIKKQIKSFQIPFYEEGFDEIIIDRKYEYYPIVIVNFRMHNFDQKNKHHKYNLDVHCEHVFQKFIKKYSNYNLGAYYHDCGKPYCQTIDEFGEAHYYCHANIGAYVLMTYFQTSSLDDLFLVNYHMMPFDWKTEKTKNKYKKLFGEYKYELLEYFNYCDSNS